MNESFSVGTFTRFEHGQVHRTDTFMVSVWSVDHVLKPMGLYEAFKTLGILETNCIQSPMNDNSFSICFSISGKVKTMYSDGIVISVTYVFEASDNDTKMVRGRLEERHPEKCFPLIEYKDESKTVNKEVYVPFDLLVHFPGHLQIQSNGWAVSDVAHKRFKTAQEQ